MTTVTVRADVTLIKELSEIARLKKYRWTMRSEMH